MSKIKLKPQHTYPIKTELGQVIFENLGKEDIQMVHEELEEIAPVLFNLNFKNGAGMIVQSGGIMVAPPDLLYNIDYSFSKKLRDQISSICPPQTQIKIMRQHLVDQLEQRGA